MTSFIMSFPHKIQLCHKPDGFLVNCILYCVLGWSTYTCLFSQFSNVAPFIKEKSRIRYVLVYPKALFTSNVFLKSARSSLALCLRKTACFSPFFSPSPLTQCYRKTGRFLKNVTCKQGLNVFTPQGSVHIMRKLKRKRKRSNDKHIYKIED